MPGCGHRDAATVLLPLVLLGAMASPAAALHDRCRDCGLPDIPFEWDDGAAAPPIVGPFAEGFALTVPIEPGQSAASRPATLDRFVEVGAALGRCVSSALPADDARWADLTLRVSFRRDGAVNGVPRVVHVSAPADATAQARGRDGVLAAVSHCAPLPFSASLGRAIAGQIFAIRFVQQRNS